MDNQKCEIIRKPFLPGSGWENEWVWELGVWAGHSSVRYIMEPPVRPERRRNWDTVQPHILALLPPPLELGVDNTILKPMDSVVPEPSVQLPLCARHGRDTTNEALVFRGLPF